MKKEYNLLDKWNTLLSVISLIRRSSIELFLSFIFIKFFFFIYSVYDLILNKLNILLKFFHLL